MPTRLSKLFRPAHRPQDGLTQPEREAVVDLLHYCMYADNHIALAEDKIIDKALVVFDWDPAVSFESCEARSIARAREAKEGDDTAKEAFLLSIKAGLSSKKARQLALDLCQKLFASDGVQSTKEAALANRLKQLLA